MSTKVCPWLSDVCEHNAVNYPREDRDG